MAKQSKRSTTQGIGLAAGLPLLLVVAASPAVPDEALRDAVNACGRIPADGPRLACFDALVLGRDLQEARFGSESVHRPEPAAPGGEGELRSIEGTIARLERLPRGERVFHLDNGQVWVEQSPGRAHYRAEMTVRIDRTPMGGYMLTTERGRATRVRRVE